MAESWPDVRVETVIFAGGVGRRMGGSKRPKQFLELGGRPIIDYTIAHFAEHPHVSGIVVACLDSWIPYLESFLQTRHYSTPIDVIAGGSTGQDSIFRGLAHLRARHPGDNEAIVLVHDGVRPLIDGDTIEACARSAYEYGPTATIAPSTETVIVTNDDGVVEHVLERSCCGLARAPQGFRLEELYAAHLRAQQDRKDDFIDSISLMSHYGSRIYTVEGPAENIKVTTPMDYYAFKGYMEARDQRMLWGDEA
ncbi:MAG: IspD/TarI family cytidylyltransferase [Atopobiaceae bacterium]|nr:IspD/TarI family cytidylyltransferase [Atopobiaceae bacterium]